MDNAPLELCLITRVVDDKDFQSLQRSQITEEFFSTPEAKEVFRFLNEVYHAPGTTGHIPSHEMIRTRFPAWIPRPCADTVPVLCHHLRREKIRMELLRLSANLQIEADSDPVAAMAGLRTETARLTSLTEVGQDLSLSGAYELLLHQYETIQNSGGVTGIPFPWHPLNEETQGMKGGEFHVIYGRPKNGKTWAAILIAAHAYLCGRRVLYYTREMPPKQIMSRMAAVIARVDYGKWKNAKLQPELREHTFQVLQRLIDAEKDEATIGNHQPLLKVISDRSATGSSGGGAGVSWIHSKIREYNPDLLIADGMYLMKDDRTNQRTVDWKAIAHISQDLKMTASDFDIPVVGVTQANRAADKSQGEDLTELAFADSLGMDADMIMRVTKKTRVIEQEGGAVQKVNELNLTFPGMREGVLDGIAINFAPCTDFSYIRTISFETEGSQGEPSRRGGGGGGGYGSGSNRAISRGAPPRTFAAPTAPPRRE